MICWVRSAIRAAFSVGSASASSKPLVCSDWVPPPRRRTPGAPRARCCSRAAGRPASRRRSGCGSAWSATSGSPSRSARAMIRAHIRRAARNLATSWKTLLWPLKKKASRGPNSSTSSPASMRRLHVGDRVGEGEAHLLHGRAALLAHVVAGDRDRVPLRHPLAAVGEQVGGQPHRRLGRVDEVPARDVLLEDVVLRGAAQLLRLHALLLADQLVEQQQHGGGRVDRHRRGDLGERDAVEHPPHVVDRVDGHAGAARPRPRTAGRRSRGRAGWAGRTPSTGRWSRGRSGSGSARWSPWRWRSPRTGASSSVRSRYIRSWMPAGERVLARLAERSGQLGAAGRPRCRACLTSMPESVKRRGSSGPTIGAIVGLLSGLVARELEEIRPSMPDGGHRPPVRDAARARRARARSCSTCPTGRAWATRSSRLGDLADGLPLVMAVNREYAAEEQVLDPGDELALIPPVSGGSTHAPWRHRRAALARRRWPRACATRAPGRWSPSRA